MTDAIVAEGLVKRFDGAVALDGVDLTVAEGTVLGLLGPNGAGKTTTVRVLTTLIRADGGYAEVAGINVAKHPAAVRRRIGLAGQFAAVDYVLTGRENLVLFGRLYRLGRRQAAKRADRLLERFGLSEVADKAVKTYSGGMARRLDLAAALVATPRVLFMDEPSVGLDPAARLELWDLLEELVRGGMTLLLTTQYLEEAERLADTIAVVDKGKVIARGTIAELKTQVGGDRVDVRIADPAHLSTAVDVLRGLAHGEPTVDAASNLVGVPASEGPSAIAEVVRALDRAGVGMLDISIHQPTLDDVFLALTGGGAFPVLPPAPSAPRHAAPAEADPPAHHVAAEVALTIGSWQSAPAPAAAPAAELDISSLPPVPEPGPTELLTAASAVPDPAPTELLPAGPAARAWIAPAPRVGDRPPARDAADDRFRSGAAVPPPPAEPEGGPDPDFVPSHRAARRETPLDPDGRFRAVDVPPPAAGRARGDHDPDATDPAGTPVPGHEEPAADPAPGPGRRRRRSAEADLDSRAAR
jgi:ABC-2 type transport system ATP-binding protein